jgi:hypothetical protein
MANWQLVSEHRRTVKGMIQITWPYLLLGSGFLAFAAMTFNFRTRSKDQTDMLIAAGVGVLLTAGMLTGAVWSGFSSASPVQVFAEGLRWGRGNQRGWDEVREVYRKEVYHLQNGAKPSDWNRHSLLRLVFADGQQARFNHSLSDYNRLAEFVQRVTIDRLLPVARSEFENSGLSFGTIHVSREGLSVNRSLLAWETVALVRAGNGNLTVYEENGKRHDFALKDLPNYLVLLRLLSELPQMTGKL